MKSIILKLAVFAIIVLFVGALILNKLKFKPTGQLNSSSNNTVPIIIGSQLINVEIADTNEKRMQGLSNKTNLSDKKGMLFIFEDKDISPFFWMKEMNFPIDIIWINDSKIVQVDKNIPAPGAQTPESELTLYKPAQPIDYVLEVSAGFSDKHDINVGTDIDLKGL